MNTPVYAQTDFRGKYDTGTESSTDWIALAHTNWTQAADTKFRIRFAVDETTGNGDAENNQYIQFQYNHNSGGWNNITTSSSPIAAIASDQAGFVDGSNCTQQISSGTFDSVNSGHDEDGIAGTAGTGDWDPDGSGAAAEFETCLIIDSGAVTNGDTIEIRCTKGPGYAISTYTYSVSLTVSSTTIVNRTVDMAVTFGGTSTLLGDGELLGTAALTFGNDTTTLTGTGDVGTLTAAVTFGTDLTGLMIGDLGTVNIVVTTETDGYEGLLTGTGALISTAAVTFGGTSTLTGDGELVGTMASTFDMDATLTQVGGGATVGAPFILRRIPWETAPQYASINWDHPLAKGLFLAWLPNDPYRHRNLVDGQFYSPNTAGNWVSGIPGRGRAIETASNATGWMQFTVQGNDTSTNPYLSHFGLYLFRATPGSDQYIQHTIIGTNNAFYTRYGPAGYHERWYENSSGSVQTGNVSITNGEPVTLAGCRFGTSVYVYKNGIYQTGASPSGGRPHLATSNLGVYLNTSPAFALGVWFQWNRGLTAGEVQQLHDNPFALFYRPNRLFISTAGAPSGDIDVTIASTFGSTFNLTGSGELTGTALATFGGTFNLSGQGELDSTSVVTFGSTLALAGLGELDSTAVSTFASDLNLTGQGELDSTAVSTFDVSSTLTGSGELASSADVAFDSTFSLTGTGELDSEATVVFDSTLSLTGTGALNSSADFVFDIDATATGGDGAIDTTIPVIFDVDANLVGTGELAGSMVSVFDTDLTGNLIGVLGGSMDSTFGGTSTLSGTGSASAGITVTFDVDATLEGVVQAVTTIPVVFDIDADLGIPGGLDCDIASIFGMSSTLTGTGALSGTVSVTFDVNARLDYWAFRIEATGSNFNIEQSNDDFRIEETESNLEVYYG